MTMQAVPDRGAEEPAPYLLASERLRLVLYGEPGVGKTTLAAGFPRPLFINTDAGLVSAALAGVAPLAMEPTSYRDLEALYLWCMRTADGYDTLVIDSFTELQRMLLDEIVDEGADKSAEGRKATQSILRYVPEQAEYLANQRQIHRVLHSLRRLGKHMVLTCGVRVRESQRTPDMSPGLLQVVMHWASVVTEMITNRPGPDQPLHRWLLFEPTWERQAKSRFTTLVDPLWIPPPGRRPTGFEAMWQRVELAYAQAAQMAGTTVPVEGS